MIEVLNVVKTEKGSASVLNLLKKSELKLMDFLLWRSVNLTSNGSRFYQKAGLNLSKVS